MGLVLGLREFDEIQIGPDIKIKLLHYERSNGVRLLVEAPKDLEIKAFGKPRRPMAVKPVSILDSNGLPQGL